MQSFSVALFFSIFSLIFVNFTYAQESMVNPEASLSASVDSYVLFWPLTAGKVEGDSNYFLKTFKEQFKGWFVFGNMKKADYEVEIASKRVLEAEKLLKVGKNDMAVQTLEKARFQLASAYSHVKNQTSKSKISRDEIRRDRLIHIKALVDYLKTTTTEEFQSELDAVKSGADALLRDYLP